MKLFILIENLGWVSYFILFHDSTFQIWIQVHMFTFRIRSSSSGWHSTWISFHFRLVHFRLKWEGVKSKLIQNCHFWIFWCHQKWKLRIASKGFRLCGRFWLLIILSHSWQGCDESYSVVQNHFASSWYHFQTPEHFPAKFFTPKIPSGTLMIQLTSPCLRDPKALLIWEIVSEIKFFWDLNILLFTPKKETFAKSRKVILHDTVRNFKMEHVSIQ
jgi:hypothetical protein